MTKTKTTGVAIKKKGGEFPLSFILRRMKLDVFEC